MSDSKVLIANDFPQDVRERIVEAIWANRAPMRLFNSIFEITETHLHRCYFNDAFKRYKKQRGTKVGGYGCVTSGQVFRDINRGYYEHMLVGIRRVIGISNDRLIPSGSGKDDSTYSLCAVLNELAGLETLVGKETSFQVADLRYRNIGPWTSKNTRKVKMTKYINAPHFLPGSFCLLRRALLRDARLLLEIANKHIAHLASDSSMRSSKVFGVAKFSIYEKHIEAALKRIVDVYDVLEHLFQPDTSHGLTREDPSALKSYESLFSVPHVSIKSMSIRTGLNQKIDSWRHGDLTCVLTRRESFVRFDRLVDQCRFNQCGAHAKSDRKSI